MIADIQLFHRYWKYVLTIAPVCGAVLIAASLTVDEYHNCQFACILFGAEALLTSATLSGRPQGTTVLVVH